MPLMLSVLSMSALEASSREGLQVALCNLRRPVNVQPFKFMSRFQFHLFHTQVIWEEKAVTAGQNLTSSLPSPTEDRAPELGVCPWGPHSSPDRHVGGVKQQICITKHNFLHTLTVQQLWDYCEHPCTCSGKHKTQNIKLGQESVYSLNPEPLVCSKGS